MMPEVKYEERHRELRDKLDGFPDGLWASPMSLHWQTYEGEFRPLPAHDEAIIVFQHNTGPQVDEALAAARRLLRQAPHPSTPAEWVKLGRAFEDVREALARLDEAAKREGR